MEKEDKRVDCSKCVEIQKQNTKVNVLMGIAGTIGTAIIVLLIFILGSVNDMREKFGVYGEKIVQVETRLTNAEARFNAQRDDLNDIKGQIRFKKMQ